MSRKGSGNPAPIALGSKIESSDNDGLSKIILLAR